MIRTDVVKLTVMKAFAYRQKLGAGDVSLVIVKPGAKQPGIAAISKKTGEAVPLAKTNMSVYPLEAFKEAQALTKGLSFHKQGPVKVTKSMLAEPKEPKAEPAVILDEKAYKKIVDRYTDKNGSLSFDLMNKEMITFVKRSSIVRNMVAEGESAKAIREYIVANKIRNIAENQELTDKEVERIVEELETVQPKGAFKELNSEIRKLLAANKKQ